eukprot:gene22497-30757_t
MEEFKTKGPAISWYPGHIAKAERELAEYLKKVDVVIEVRDARIPLSTTHPSVPSWVGSRPLIVAIARLDQISSTALKDWREYYAMNAAHPTRPDAKVYFVDGKLVKKQAMKAGVAVNERRRRRGIEPRAVRAAVIGFPNGVGGGGDVQPGQRLARQDSQLCKDEQDHRTMSGDEIVFEVARKLYKGNAISASDRLLSDFRKGFLGFGSLEAPIDGQKWPIKNDVGDQEEEDDEEEEVVGTRRVADIHLFGTKQEQAARSDDEVAAVDDNNSIVDTSGSPLIGSVGRGKYEGW